MPDSAASSSTPPPALSSEEKKFELLLKGKARCDAGFEKWMQDLKAEDEERFDGSVAAAKRAGNAMVIMWAFCIRKRDKIVKSYPNGSPEIPAPTRCLIRSFLNLEELARGGLVCMPKYAQVRLMNVATEAARADRKKILKYYYEILHEKAKKGHTYFDLTQVDLDNAPKLGTGDILDFDFVKKELKEGGFNVTGDAAPYKIKMFQGQDGEITQSYIDFMKDQYGNSSIEKSVLTLEVPQLPDSKRSVSYFRQLASKAKVNDIEKIADFFTKHVECSAGKGYTGTRVSKSCYEQAPKMQTKKIAPLDSLKEEFNKRGFVFTVSEGYDHDTAADEDTAFSIGWQGDE